MAAAQIDSFMALLDMALNFNELPAWIKRLIAALDPIFPVAVVPSDGPRIDDGAIYGESGKPPFVQADDEGWTRC